MNFQSSCFGLLNAGFPGVRNHAQPQMPIFTEHIPNQLLTLEIWSILLFLRGGVSLTVSHCCWKLTPTLAKT